MKPLAKILIYYQANKRTVFLESLAESFQKKGYHVIFYSTSSKGALTDALLNLSVENYFEETPKNKNVYFYELKNLFKFIIKHKVDIIYSHLQRANLVALLVGKMLQIPVVPCRHHIDVSFIYGNRNARFQDRLINILSDKQVVVSEQAKDFMIENERGNKTHIIPIPLGYDFSHYNSKPYKEANRISEQVSHTFCLITISRHIPFKRHEISIKVVAELNKRGYDVGLILLDEGQTTESLKSLSKNLDISDKVYFFGFQNDIMPFIHASDIILHPSISESSNQIIKEGGFAGKTAMVCSGVGDFDSYLRHKDNAFLVSKDNTEIEMIELLSEIFAQSDYKSTLNLMADNLKKDVLKRFDIENVSEQYLSFLNKK